MSESFGTWIRRSLALLLALAIPFATGAALTGCGKEEETATGGTDTSASKVEIAARLGAATWLTKRYIVTPAKEGSFAKDAKKRKRSIAKAALAGAVSAKLVKGALEEAKKDPALAGAAGKLAAVVGTGGALTAIQSALKGNGDIGSIAESAIGGITGSGIEGVGSGDEKPGGLLDLVKGSGVGVGDLLKLGL